MMNLEGGNTFSNGGQTCADFGPDACDYVTIYDGTKATAFLLCLHCSATSELVLQKD